MTLHILTVDDEQLTIVLQSLLANNNPKAKEVSIRFKNMATPFVPLINHELPFINHDDEYAGA